MMRTHGSKITWFTRGGSIAAVVACVVLVLQSLVPFTSYALATMKCGSALTGMVVATRVVEAPADNGRSVSTVTPDCCLRMGLACPMRHDTMGYAVATSKSPKASRTVPMLPACILTVSTTGHNRVFAAANRQSHTVAIAMQPTSREVVQIPLTRDPGASAFFCRPPPRAQSLTALSQRPLRAPPIA